MNKFDVFVSFRGIDTRRTFLSHLYRSLSENQIRTYRNDEERSANEHASSQVLQSIQESRIAIAVISKNYTDSVSRIDELAKMIECKEKGSLLIVPVFYQTDPLVFAEKAENLAHKLSQIRTERRKMVDFIKCRHALIDLALVYQEYASGVTEEAEIINRVIDYISSHLRTTRPRQSERQLKMTTYKDSSSSWSNNLSIFKLISLAIKSQLRIYRSDISEEEDEETITSGSSVYERRFVTGNPYIDFDNFIGMDRKMKEVATFLDLDSDDGVIKIGIWGVGGSGKTSLARCVYEQISSQFQDYYYYLVNDTNNNRNSSSLTCLLEDVTRACLTPMSKSLATRNSDVVKAKLGHRKVLLVVDGLDHIDQLKRITMVARLFGPGSRLILVTQEKSLLVECDVEHLYEVESLRYDEALQLFTQFAFEQKEIRRGVDELSSRAVLVAARLPLAIKVLGSLLRGKEMKEWESVLIKLEESRDKRFSAASPYIKYPPKVNQYSKEDARDKYPSYCFAFA